jgi:O-antigen ligase
VRVTGPFSFVSGLTTYLPTMFALLLGLISLQRKDLSSRWKLLYYASVAGAVVVTFMSGSRAPVVILIVVALVFYSFTSIKHLFNRLAQIAVLGSLVFAGTFFMFPQAFDAFYERTFGEEETINEGLERMYEPFRIPVDEAYYAGPFGYGIGTTQNSVSVLMAMFNPGHSGNLIPVPYENEMARIMLELGVIGFLIYTLFRLVIILTVFQICFSIRDPESRILAFAILGALISPLLFGGAIVSHTQNVYQWFLIGALLALANAERIVTHQNHQEETPARAVSAR